MTINVIGGLNWSQYTSQIAQKRNVSRFALEDSGADTANISSSDKNLTPQSGATNSEAANVLQASGEIDFSKLPADLVRVLKEGGDDLPSAQDIALMASQEPYFNLPTGKGNGFAAWDTLTTSDKQLIKASTGWDMFSDPFGKTASPEALAFAGRLNMDRYSDSHYGSTSGLNGGEITESYIDKLIQENFSATPGQALVPLSILNKVQATYLSMHTNQAPKSQ